MPRYVAFLRAINVGGHTVKMDHLKGLFESIGFKDVQTFIASGNVIFHSASKNSAALEKKIEVHLRKALGYEVATFLRSETELKQAAEYRAFRDKDVEKYRVYVAFLHSKPGKEAIDRLMSFSSRIDDFRVHEREVYWLCRKKMMMDSKFSPALLEKTIGMTSTLRSSTTIMRLAALLSSKGVFLTGLQNMG